MKTIQKTNERLYRSIQVQECGKGMKQPALSDILGSYRAKNFPVKALQRKIVRVGYDEGESKSENPFISSRHKAIEKMVNKLPEYHEILDYTRDGLVIALSPKGIKEDKEELNIVGHGQPGLIAGLPGNTVAAGIKTRMGVAAADIKKINLYSCFSNIADEAAENAKNGGKSVGKSFKEQFNGEGVEVKASSGIYLAAEDTIIPPKYCAYKYAAAATKNYILVHNPELKTADSDTNLKKAKEVNQKINACISPMDLYVAKYFALYDTLHDEGTSNRDLDVLPKRDYPDELKSINEGVNATYSVLKDDLGKKKVRDLKTVKDESRAGITGNATNDLESAKSKCDDNYKKLDNLINPVPAEEK